MAVRLVNTKRNVITIQVLGPLEEIEHLVIPPMASGPLVGFSLLFDVLISLIRSRSWL